MSALEASIGAVVTVLDLEALAADPRLRVDEGEDGMTERETVMTNWTIGHGERRPGTPY